MPLLKRCNLTHRGLPAVQCCLNLQKTAFIMASSTNVSPLRARYFASLVIIQGGFEIKPQKTSPGSLQSNFCWMKGDFVSEIDTFLNVNFHFGVCVSVCVLYLDKLTSALQSRENKCMEMYRKLGKWPECNALSRKLLLKK